MSDLIFDNMQKQWQSSHLSALTQEYLFSLYESYLTNPDSLPAYWVEYFATLAPVALDTSKPLSDIDYPHNEVVQQFEKLGLHSRKLKNLNSTANLESSIKQEKQVRVAKLIDAYRTSGHLTADIDPLQLIVRDSPQDLKPEYYNFTNEELNEEFSLFGTHFGVQSATLTELIRLLKTTYSSTMGVEYMHIPELEERLWIQYELESEQSHPALDDEEKLRLYKRLVAAEGLETYLANKFPGTKRFGLEGGESLIPLLDEMIQDLGANEVKEVVIGMAHRGRLNVLVNIFGKNPADLFSEFQGKSFVSSGSGDVKYHQGFSSNVKTDGGDVHLALAFNPSHLEIANPVVMGSVRARQDRRDDALGDKVVPILIHGDAAFAGQGVVMESLQMCKLRGYQVGGTLHIIVNNQIGFTTNNKLDSRSTRYCTDVAKMINAPVIHVNGDDPERVAFAAKLAVKYRAKFHKDIVIDMYCYRRRGHNEADEPMATQPEMYSNIHQRDTTASLYGKKLIADNMLLPEQDSNLKTEYRNKLDSGTHVVDSWVNKANEKLFVDWTKYLGLDWTDEADTKVSKQRIQDLGQRIFALPENFTLQRQVDKLMQERRAMVLGEQDINWGCAELLAYASILEEDFPVRFTGQDARRGTFAHRHSYVYDQKNFENHGLLSAIETETAKCRIYDSFLSEEAVLGFEYGYATTSPNTLTIWEAQFGDFVNGAQVVIDQFITSGEHKWQRLCGLVMLLPHGYEGSGPEHSSARLERFVQMCAETNIQLCVPSSASQIFHLLRRQITRNIRKPLIIMSPKSLLRKKEASSPLSAFTDGHFRTVICKTAPGIPSDKIKRIIFCSGKLYYDLLEYRRLKERFDTAIIRIEQIYPFPAETLVQTIQEFTDAKTFVWAQEEPRNQGFWFNGQHWIINALKKAFKKGPKLLFAGRGTSAAPAVGLMSVHIEQQNQLIEKSFTI